MVDPVNLIVKSSAQDHIHTVGGGISTEMNTYAIGHNSKIDESGNETDEYGYSAQSTEEEPGAMDYMERFGSQSSEPPERPIEGRTSSPGKSKNLVRTMAQMFEKASQSYSPSQIKTRDSWQDLVASGYATGPTMESRLLESSSIYSTRSSVIDTSMSGLSRKPARRGRKSTSDGSAWKSADSFSGSFVDDGALEYDPSMNEHLCRSSGCCSPLEEDILGSGLPSQWGVSKEDVYSQSPGTGSKVSLNQATPRPCGNGQSSGHAAQHSLLGEDEETPRVSRPLPLLSAEEKDPISTVHSYKHGNSDHAQLRDVQEKLVEATRERDVWRKRAEEAERKLGFYEASTGKAPYSMSPEIPRACAISGAPATPVMERRGWRRTSNASESAMRNLHSVCVPGAGVVPAGTGSRLSSRSFSGSRAGSGVADARRNLTPSSNGSGARDTSMGVMDIWMAAQQLLEKEEGEERENEKGDVDQHEH